MQPLAAAVEHNVTRLHFSAAPHREGSGVCRKADTLDPLFALFAAARLPEEGFGDFCHRLGRDALAQALAAAMKGVA